MCQWKEVLQATRMTTDGILAISKTLETLDLQMPNRSPSVLRWPANLEMILVRSYPCESCP